MTRILFFISIAFLSCNEPSSKQKGSDQSISTNKDSDTNEFNLENPQAQSLLGYPLNSKEPSEKIFQRWREKYLNYEDDKTKIDNIIWHGRFTAYMGDYLKAIDIYTKGIELHSDDARLYRHRGHRYITTRQLDLAIQDFEKAEELIEGKENEVEPDGMPNERNIPVSSLHGNIFYHLGLAHYLKGSLLEAEEAFQKCLATSRMNDNVVSASHWLYMIRRLLGKNAEAQEVVGPIEKDWDIIENMSYHQLCLLYNGSINENEILNVESNSSANDAVLYGIANWHVYNGREEKGVRLLNEIIDMGHWASFGHIAAEADLARRKKLENSK